MTEMLNQCFPLVKQQRLFPMHLIIHLYISLKIEKFYYRIEFASIYDFVISFSIFIRKYRNMLLFSKYRDWNIIH